MPLKVSATQTELPASDDRQQIVEELLAELTIVSNPREQMTAFKSWLRGSLSLIHLHALAVLEAEGPLSMSRLAVFLDVSVASTTGIVDRMEQRGLVERRHGDDDRRIVVVHPTHAGAAVFLDLAAQRRARLAAVLEHLSDEELRGFLVGIRAMHRARIAAGHAAPAADDPAASDGDVPAGPPASGAARP
ncbi:MAG: MarR family transcriptional regulator [Chloroflexi bacterium]|nr:MarR family transcriptional regulator [Chloroflexota bacterium]